MPKDTIFIECPSDLKDKAVNLAKEMDLNLSQLIRKLLREALAKQKK